MAAAAVVASSPRDGELKVRKEWAQKVAKFAAMGKGYSAAEYLADEIREEAARRVAEEIAAEAGFAADKALPGTLQDAVVADLKAQLQEARVKLMYQTSARELQLQEQVETLKGQVSKLTAELHWQDTYGWTLPGAFLLAYDGECTCSRARRLHGGNAANRAPDGGTYVGTVCDCR